MVQEIDAVKSRLDEKRTFRGWMQDAFGNLLVNVVTILEIGIAAIGLKALDSFTTRTESRVGLGDEKPSSSPPAASAPAASSNHS
jgi:hypothetical protein